MRAHIIFQNIRMSGRAATCGRPLPKFRNSSSLNLMQTQLCGGRMQMQLCGGRLRAWCAGAGLSGTRGIVVNIRFPDDTEKIVQGTEGASLLQALEAADVSDVWPGGACGGSCACSTCRVFIGEKWIEKLPAAEDVELDLLDSALKQDEKETDDAQETGASARLACQITLTHQLDGLLVLLPRSMHNMLEIPLWLRNR